MRVETVIRSSSQLPTPDNALLVGLDLGGTKSAILAQTADGRTVVDIVVPSLEWDAEPVEHGARWVDTLLRAKLPADSAVLAVGIGAQGLDNPDVAKDFADELATLGYRARCVNDAELLVPAAGFATGIGLISGTGAIGVGADSDGNPLGAFLHIADAQIHGRIQVTEGLRDH